MRPKDLSRNPDAVQSYIDDPLCIKGKLVARTAIQISKAFDTAKKRRGELTCPILMLHGADDHCTSINAACDFFRNVGSHQKRFLQLPGMYHELFEEPEVDQLMVSIAGFASSGGKEFARIDGEEKDGLVNVAFN